MNAYRLELYGTCVKDMQEQFEAYVAQQRPEPNRLQKFLYGEGLESMSDEMVRDIVVNNRGCGTSTAKVLRNIAAAIEAKGVPVAIEFEYEHKTDVQKKYFREYIRSVVTKLDLKYIDINPICDTIKLDI